MHDDVPYYTENAPAPSNGGWATGFTSLLGGLAGAAGTVISATRGHGNGSSQDAQAASRAQIAAAQTSANNKMLLWGGIIVAGLAVIGFILLRKR